MLLQRALPTARPSSPPCCISVSSIFALFPFRSVITLFLTLPNFQSLLIIFHSYFQEENSSDESQIENPPGVVYQTTDRLDWIQAATGTNGGWIETSESGKKIYAPSITSASVAGQAFMGFISSYLFITFLVSLYLAYISVPPQMYAPLFLEPRGLTFCNSMIVWGMPQAVFMSFRRCGKPYQVEKSFGVVFLAILLYGDAALLTVVRGVGKMFLRKKGSSQDDKLEPIFLTILGFIPFLGSLGDLKTPTVACSGCFPAFLIPTFFYSQKLPDLSSATLIFHAN